MEKILGNKWAKLGLGLAVLYGVYRFAPQSVVKTAAVGAMGGLLITRLPVVDKLYA